MKAIVYTRYGTPDVFHLEDVKKAVLDEENVLVKVHAASIHAGDYFWLGGSVRQRFALCLMPSLDGLTNDSREVFL